MMKNLIKRGLAAAISLTMLLSSVPATTFALTADEPQNLAFGKTVQLFDLGFDPVASTPSGIEKLTDGAVNDYYYGSNAKYSHAYRVDLGSVQNINEVVASFVKEGNHGEPQMYDILTSEDGVYYTVAAVVEGENSSAITTRTINFANRDARYVFVRGYTPENRENAMFISEIEVYSNPEVDIVAPDVENLALGADVKAYAPDGTLVEKSFQEADNGQGTYIFSNITDGNEVTSGVAGQINNHMNDVTVGWYPVVTLDEAVVINSIRLAFYPVLIPPSYTLDVSTDGVIWKNVGGASIAGAYGHNQSIITYDFEAQPVKYIRVVDNTRASFMRIAEIQAFNTQNDESLASAPAVKLQSCEQNGAAVSGWDVVAWSADSADMIKIALEDKEGAVSSVTVGGAPYTIGDEIKITQKGDIEVKVTTSEDGKNDRVSTFKIKVGDEVDLYSVNWAKGKDVSVTTWYGSPHVSLDTSNLGAVVDENFDTVVFAGAGVENHDYTVDLGTLHSIDKVLVAFNQSAHKSPTNYRINVSQDNKNWDIVYTNTEEGVTGLKKQTAEFEEKLVRYIKIDTDSDAGVSGDRCMHLAEFQAFGRGPIGATEVSAPQVTLAPSDKFGAQVDGYSVTKWSANANDSIKIEVEQTATDATSIVTINGVDYTNRNFKLDYGIEANTAQARDLDVVVTTYKDGYDANVTTMTISVPAADTTEPEPVNYVAGKDVKVYAWDGTENENPPDGLNQVIDGKNENPNWRLDSYHGGMTWWNDYVVDLGTTHLLDRIFIAFNDSANYNISPSEYSVKVSIDGRDWEEVYLHSRDGGGYEGFGLVENDIAIGQKVIRYIKLDALTENPNTNNIGCGMMLSSIEAYGKGECAMPAQVRLISAFESGAKVDGWTVTEWVKGASDKVMLDIIEPDDLSESSAKVNGVAHDLEDPIVIESEGLIEVEITTKTPGSVDVVQTFTITVGPEASLKNFAGTATVVGYDKDGFKLEETIAGHDWNLAVDNNTNTYTQGAKDTIAEKGWYADIILERTQDPDRAKINTINVAFDDGGVPDEYEVLVSKDGYIFESVGSFTRRDGTSVRATFEKREVLAVRIKDLTGTKSMKLAEVAVLVNTAMNSEENLAKNATFHAYTPGGVELLDSHPGNTDPEEHSIDKAIDGNFDTCTVPNLDGTKSAFPGWYAILDLGKITTVDTIIAKYGYTQTASLSSAILLSEDGKEWEAVFTRYGQAMGYFPTTTVEFIPTKARYIKVQDLGAGEFMTFYEIEAYHKGRLEQEPQKTAYVNADTPASFLLSDDSGAVLSYDNEFAPSKAVDGDLATVAKISGKSNYAIELDLGQVRHDINEIEIYFGAEGDASKKTPDNYTIEVSTDRIAWRTMATVTDCQKYYRAQFPDQTMRYVRVKDMTNEDTVMQIGEIKVNHTTASIKTPPLAVTGVYPTDTYYVESDQKINVYFNRSVGSVTTLHKAFAILNSDGGRITPQITVDASGTIVTIDPGKLDRNARYFITIDYNALGVEPIKGMTGLLVTDIWRGDLGDNVVIGSSASYIDVNGNPLPAKDERDANLAIDGNLSTMAMADTSLSDSSAWGLQIELPEVTENVGKVIVHFGKYNLGTDYTPEKYDLYTSVDGEEWEFARSVEYPNKRTLSDILFKPRRVKYFRIVSRDDNRTQMAIGEFEAYQVASNLNSYMEVVGITPVNGATEVALNATVKVEFTRPFGQDEETRKAKLYEAVKILNLKDNSQVEYEIIKIDSTDTIFTLKPLAPFEIEGKYKVVIDKDLLEIKSGELESTFNTYRETYDTEGNVVNPQRASIKVLDNSVSGSSIGAVELPMDANFPDKSKAYDHSYEGAMSAAGKWQWTCELDLGEVAHNANEVRVHFYDDGVGDDGIPSSYEIFVSLDGENWTSVGKDRQTTETKRQLVYAQFDPQAIRYVRVRDTYDYSYGEYATVGTYPDGQIGKYGVRMIMRISEIEVYTDKTLPAPAQTVIGVEPKDAYGKVALDSDIKVSFMRAIEDFDLAKASISVETMTGEKVSGQYSLNDTATTVIFDPDEDLKENTQYVVKIDGETMTGQAYADTKFYTTLKSTEKENLALGGKVYLLHPRVTGYFDRDGLRAGENGEYDTDILSQTSSYYEPNATDGNYESGACASGHWNYQLEVDLGEVKQDVNEVRIYFGDTTCWPTQTPQEYKISVSEDGTNYTTIRQISSGGQNHNLPGTIKVNFVPTSARYVRVTDLQEKNINVAGARYQMIINELEVYAKDDSEALEIKASPDNNQVDVSAQTAVEFVSNKPLVNPTVTLTDINGNPVNARVSYNETSLSVTATPTSILDFGATYIATLSIDGSEYTSVTFTTENTKEFVITTTSSTTYDDQYLPGGEVVRGDQANAIYPAFVDNIEYQSWTLDGSKRYFQLAQQGGVGEITWKLTNGKLPTGLELTNDGKIQGTPTEEGEFDFKVTATDSIGRTTSKELVMEARPYRAKWHQEARFGLMTQWCGAAYPIITSVDDLWQFDARATEFDADEWADIAQSVGARVFNCMAWAGDGIRLWPSKAPSQLNLSTKRDYLQEIIDAMHERGIKVVAYVPCGFNWQRETGMVDAGPDGGFQSLNAALLSELVDKGIDGIWFDGDGSVNITEWFDWEVNTAILRTKNPNLIFGSNPLARHSTWALQYPNCDFIIHEGVYQGDAEQAKQFAKWSPTTKKISSEINVMLQDGWVDNGEKTRSTCLSADVVIDNIKTNWDHDATYMLNVASMANGNLLLPNAEETVKEIGEWVTANINSYDFGIERRIQQVDSVDANATPITAIKSMDGNAQSLVYDIQNGSIDNYDAYVGLEFVTGQNPVTITHLGRYVLDGNNQVHKLRLAKQEYKLKILREVEIDLSTAQVDENGFAYVEIEPITLDKSAVYYIMSSENTSDSYARPYIWTMTSDYGIIANSPVWCDYSGTRVMTYYGPGNYVMGYPYMATPDSVYGGGLTNFKAVASDANHDGNLAYGSSVVVQTPTGGLTDASRSNFDLAFGQRAVDQDPDTYTLAGDGNWAYGLRFDLGEVKKNISEITVKYFGGYHSFSVTVYASNDNNTWWEIHKQSNNYSPDQLTMKLENPVDARYIRISNARLEGSIEAGLGCMVLTSEVEIKTNNIAGGSAATMMNYNATAPLSTAEDSLSFASFATDQNSRTSAKASTKGASIKLDFGKWIDIESIDVDTQNTDIEYLVSADGKTWEALDQSKIEYTDGNKVVFKEVGVKDTPQQAKFMLVRSADKSQILDVADIYVVGEASENPPKEQEPIPDQPPVGGGGGGSSSSDSSTSSDGSTGSTDTGVVAPDVKPGWAKTSNGEWTYGKEDGKATIGWAKIDGLWYHFDDNGIMQTGWYKDVDGKWYYFNAYGAMTTGWVHDGNAWYYMNSAGAMLTGWIMVDSKWYYLDGSGAMVTGWRQVGASWYYFKPNGAMVTGWQLIGGKWYYMHSTGSMAFNQWIETNGKWYYVTSDGSMAVNTTIGTYKVDENGVWVG